MRDPIGAGEKIEHRWARARGLDAGASHKVPEGAFGSLKAQEALAWLEHPADQPTPVTASKGATTSATAMQRSSAIATLPAPGPTAQTAPAAGAAPARQRMQDTSSGSKVLWRRKATGVLPGTSVGHTSKSMIQKYPTKGLRGGV